MLKKNHQLTLSLSLFDFRNLARVLVAVLIAALPVAQLTSLVKPLATSRLRLHRAAVISPLVIQLQRLLVVTPAVAVVNEGKGLS